MLLVHALEMAHDPSALLREVWRVLAGGGRLLLVVPNRRGVWARIDTTPFGHGRPYSRSQITHLLRETWFTPTGWGEALHVPPVPRGWFLRSAVAWERAGAAIAAPFAGVHIVEATKQVYRAIPARRERAAAGAGAQAGAGAVTEAAEPVGTQPKRRRSPGAAREDSSVPSPRRAVVADAARRVVARAAAMTAAAAMQREAVGLVVVPVLALAAPDRLLRRAGRR